MANRQILLASFIPKDKVNWFLDFINIKFGINKKYVFIFELENENDYMLTYSVRAKERIDLYSMVYKTLIIHKKKNTIYTINALNKLIEMETGAGNGNIIHQNHKIEWGDYNDKLILVVDDNMVISDIKRIFLNN